LKTDFAMDVEQLQRVLPHRYPFLLVDRVLEVEPGKRAVGLKNVTINEQFFNGHFPGQPIMPGVLVLEAMAQAGAVIMLSLPEQSRKIALIIGFENVRFRKQVIPGDTLITEVNLLWFKRNIGKISMQGRVNGEIAAEGELSFALTERRNEDGI
jgi:3-hydroxyacyl-[acyl-carrier-protein] dehydratase